MFTPTFGITCFGGSGGCVDLDGSVGPGLLTATLPAPGGAGIYAVIFTFELSGNQRARDTSDEFYFGIAHDGEPFFISPISVAWDEPFQTYGLVIDFVTIGGSWTAYVGTLSGDFIGPILDNFEFIVSARSDVPAPATLALFGLGAAALAAARRRQARAASNRPGRGHRPLPGQRVG